MLPSLSLEPQATSSPRHHTMAAQFSALQSIPSIGTCLLLCHRQGFPAVIHGCLASVQDWQPFAQLAWASCAMKILEAWSAGITILLAGLLPNPEVVCSWLTN